VPDSPEESLRRLIPARLREVSLPTGSVVPAAVVFVAEQGNEHETLRWLYATGGRTFSREEAVRLGQITMERRWKTFARAVRDAYVHKEREDLLPAVMATRTLLSWLDQIKLALLGDEEREAGAHRPLDVFVSYAHQDDAERELLKRHLSSLRKEGFIRHWDDRQLEPGQWEKQIHERLGRADLVLLLVSASFNDSDYCEREAGLALERFERGECLVIPIILRECDWEKRPWGKLTALPEGGHAILGRRWRDADEAFANVARNLWRWIREWQDRSARSLYG
jgi:hypothetical protein